MSLTNNPGRAEAADRAASWLYGAAMPLWLEYGVDWNRGGFHESLTHESLQSTADFKRLRVLTRQIYVFSEGALQGVDRAQDAVEHGLDFLLTSARHPDGGFHSRFDLDGVAIDETRDLYDLAFVLFALAHAHRVTGGDRLKREALMLLEFIQTTMRHPAGGYVEGLPSRGPRRQNPHMHLLEGALACLEHMPDPAFAALVDELTGLCSARFMDAERALLFEYFTDDLSQPLRPEGKALVEPGHHMEWAWLFSEVVRVRGAPALGGESLVRFALDHGLDRETGLLRGELFEDGGVASASVRLWPHSEWMKAALRVPAIAPTGSEAWRALSRFLDTETPGLWYEQWDADQRAFLPAPAAASSLYHITTAIVALSGSA